MNMKCVGAMAAAATVDRADVVSVHGTDDGIARMVQTDQSLVTHDNC